MPVGQGRAATSFTTCCEPLDGSMANKTLISFSFRFAGSGVSAKRSNCLFKRDTIANEAS